MRTVFVRGISQEEQYQDSAILYDIFVSSQDSFSRVTAEVARGAAWKEKGERHRYVEFLPQDNHFVVYI